MNRRVERRKGVRRETLMATRKWPVATDQTLLPVLVLVWVYSKAQNHSPAFLTLQILWLAAN